MNVSFLEGLLFIICVLFTLAYSVFASQYTHEKTTAYLNLARMCLAIFLFSAIGLMVL